MARLIQCSNPNCGRTFAKLLGDRTIDMKRQKQQVIVTGKDLQIIATCGWCKEKTTLFVEEGKFEEEGVTFKDVLPKPDDEKLSEEEKLKREKEAEKEQEEQDNALRGNKPDEDEDDGSQSPPDEDD